MATYRVCRSFTVESGHMLSKHPEACRFPHGHTRRIEVVVSAKALDANDMVLDFKALKLALESHIDRFDHAMAVNSSDPLRATLEALGEQAVVVFQGEDPTTEVMARRIFEFADEVLRVGFVGVSEAGARYEIPAGRVCLERVRVWETPNSWAEYGA